MDADEDRVLTRAGLLAEIKRTFDAYDGNRDGALTEVERAVNVRVRSALAGFIRQHAAAPAGQILDGQSLLPLLKDTSDFPQRPLFWHFPCYIGRGEPASAVRIGDWNLIEKFADRSLELFNLHDDVGESTNLVKREPEKVQELRSALTAWQAEVKAPTPSQVNPAYDPQSRRRGGRRTPDR